MNTNTYQQYKDNYNTGVYIRIGNKDILLEDLTPTQLQQYIEDLNLTGIYRAIQLLVFTHQNKDHLIKDNIHTITLPSHAQISQEEPKNE